MASMKILGLMALVAYCSGVAVVKPEKTTILITKDSTAECATSERIPLNTEFRIETTGESPMRNCMLDFTANTEDNCQGLCYLFSPNAMFRDPNVSMVISSGGKSTVYNMTHMTHAPVCTQNKEMKFNLLTEAGYKFDKDAPVGYRFILDIYNKCGPRGSIEGITFDEAVKNLDGYHHGKDREDRERNNYISGIFLGFGLACIFLVVLLIAYCYVRNSPNRGPNRSVGMPKVGGFKKNMKPNKEPAAASGTEMGVRYTATGEAKPEAKPLLTGKASDPEKPPADTHVVAEEGGK